MEFECTRDLNYAQLRERVEQVRTERSWVTVGRVRLLPEEAEEAVERGLYIVNYRTVWQVLRDGDGGYHGKRLYYKRDDGGVPLTGRGRYSAFKAGYVNRLVGFHLVDE